MMMNRASLQFIEEKARGFLNEEESSLKTDLPVTGKGEIENERTQSAIPDTKVACDKVAQVPGVHTEAPASDDQTETKVAAVADNGAEANANTGPAQSIREMTKQLSEPEKLAGEVTRTADSAESKEPAVAQIEKTTDRFPDRFTKETPTYQWQMDDETWRNFSKEKCAELHRGYLNWQEQGSQLFVANTMDMRIRGNVYVIEFVMMTQTNDETGRFRKLRNRADLSKPCRWADACTAIDCHFFHPAGKDRRGLEDDARGKIPCRWGDFCTRVACPFIHPIDARVSKEEPITFPCKLADACWEPNCEGNHPSKKRRPGLVGNEDNWCRYGDNCTRTDCLRAHPNAHTRKGIRCKFGDMCHKIECQRYHPTGDNRQGLVQAHRPPRTPNRSASGSLRSTADDRGAGLMRRGRDRMVKPTRLNQKSRFPSSTGSFPFNRRRGTQTI